MLRRELLRIGIAAFAGLVVGAVLMAMVISTAHILWFAPLAAIALLYSGKMILKGLLFVVNHGFVSAIENIPRFIGTVFSSGGCLGSLFGLILAVFAIVFFANIAIIVISAACLIMGWVQAISALIKARRQDISMGGYPERYEGRPSSGELIRREDDTPNDPFTL